jgi:hypothetical protein
VRETNERQRQTWGDDHDDEHTPGEWLGLLAKYQGRAAAAVFDQNMEAYRENWVKVGALVLALLEQHDRVLDAVSPWRVDYAGPITPTRAAESEQP